jgi:outer membrane usher protein FimD/PapC
MRKATPVAFNVVAIIFALLQAAPLSAHHSFGMFDTTQRVVVEGEVKEFRMVNPHSFIVVAVKDADGKTNDWWIEAHSLLVLKRQGWTRDSLKAGDQIRLIVNPLRTSQPGGYMVEATVNGQLVGQRAQP